MASLPPVTLGAVILSAFTVIAVLRAPAERRYVLQAKISSRPKRQFVLDLTLYLTAGLLAVTFNLSVFKFPLTSALSLLFGCAVSGFFMALDTSLARERTIIVEAMQNNKSLPPPKRLFPVTRKFSLVAVAATLFVALIIVMVISRDIIWLSKIEQTESALAEAQISVTYEIFFIMAVLLAMTINLILSYSKNLRLLFDNETRVLERVSHGDLNKLVPVTTNDEFGLIADYTNAMIMGLRERLKLITALKVAEEVQKNLLPHHAPKVSGLDISGISIYCDTTGGDYFDYLKLPGGGLGVVVADASDHGIGAALHMTTARAFLISGTPHVEHPAELLNTVNSHMVRDSSKMGRFVSMFLVFIDPVAKNLYWVRAGHEPALLFDPKDARFQKLDGEGVVLGVDESYRYQESTRRGWTPGSVLVIGTDGIHETRNEKGAYFGRQRLQDLIHKNHAQTAKRIQKTIVAELTKFRGNAPQEDDVTLVVVKLD